MSEAGVECAVLCQHLGQFDNSYLASLLASRIGPIRRRGADRSRRRRAGRRPWPTFVQLGFRGLRITSDALRERPGAFAYAAASAGLNQILYAPEGIGAIVGASASNCRRPTRRWHSSSRTSATRRSRTANGPRRRAADLGGPAERLCAAVRARMFCPYPYTAARRAWSRMWSRRSARSA